MTLTEDALNVTNPKLTKGEVAFDSQGRMKIGNGRTHYNDLEFEPVVAGPAGPATIGPRGLRGTGVAGEDGEGITPEDQAKLDDLSGVNTGDQDLSGLVPVSRTVNGQPLSANVAVTAADVGAPAGSGTSTGTNTGDQSLAGYYSASGTDVAVADGGTGASTAAAARSNLAAAASGANADITSLNGNLVFSTNLVEYRNGASNQNFYLYNFYTDASNYERLNFTAGGSYYELKPAKAGTGVFRQLIINGGANNVILTVGGTAGNWNVKNSSGDFYPGTDNSVDIGDSTHGVKKLFMASTITAAGTTGAQTINKSRGTVRFAAAATTLVVTNSLVTATSKIVAKGVGAFDATATNFQCTAASGSFTITANAAATAEIEVVFDILIP